MHEKILTLNGEDIVFDFRKSRRARMLRLSIYPGGLVRATSPFRLGEALVLGFIKQKAEWIVKKVLKMKDKKEPFLKGSREEYLLHKEAARKLVYARLEYFNKTYGFRYNKISIRNQATRWGSCSRKGNLNFTYKLVQAPERISDYIVVHELCHLGEFNHSKKFWDLVAKTVPDYVSVRKEIKNL